MKRSSVVLAVVAAAQATCHQAILTAPPGSTLTLQANPPFVAAFGDVSVVTAVVYEPAGTPVPDGTVVQFFCSIGRIDEQGKTNDGVARVNFVSDSRSGTARCTAISGGGSIAPPPSTITPPSTTVTAAPGASLLAAGTVTAAAGANSATVDIVVGSARPASVRVSAFPSRLREQRTAQITANVFDGSGNPVSNVPVFFSLSNNATHESLESRGQPRFTDNNGQAIDYLTTVYPETSPPRIAVVVTATTANGVSGTTELVIN
ncbi:MAG TPA: Ig-like domain-containing protein [Vicinamibacteria bacterium]